MDPFLELPAIWPDLHQTLIGTLREAINRKLPRHYEPMGLVEIDLIRAGRRSARSKPVPKGHYAAFVSRADRRPSCEVRCWNVERAMPAIPIPLLSRDADVELDLQGAFDTAYERGAYERLIDYGGPIPAPAFEGAHQRFFRSIVRGAVQN
jgi:hypothetical protein